MIRKLVLLVTAVLFAVPGLLGSGATSWTPAEAQPAPTWPGWTTSGYIAGETLRDPNTNRAMGLQATVGCSGPKRAALLLFWQRPRYEFYSQVWVDLSANPNNFQPGTFFARGPLPVGTSVIEWDGLLEGQTHYARVNVLHGAGLPLPLQGYPFWATSDTVVFTTPLC